MGYKTAGLVLNPKKVEGEFDGGVKYCHIGTNHGALITSKLLDLKAA